MQRLSDSVTRESLFSSYLDKFEDVEYSEDIGVGQE